MVELPRAPLEATGRVLASSDGSTSKRWLNLRAIGARIGNSSHPLPSHHRYPLLYLKIDLIEEEGSLWE